MAEPRPTFPANGYATLIGSLPVADHQEALALIFAHTPEIPLWPQLPANPAEGMLSQFVEGFPGLREEEGRLWFNTGDEQFEAEQLAFFEQYLAVSEKPDLLPDSCFAISRQRANGLYLLREQAKNRPGTVAVKGQITGPFTLLTGLKDSSQRDAYYDPALREIGVKGLAMRSAWQTRFLADCGLPVLLFVDEPALAGLGSSSYISISQEEIGQDLGEILTAIHGAGGLAGVHVCANTDWPFLLSLDLDVLSFDAYGFFDRLAVCREALSAFLDRGGIIAWGVVPTSEPADIAKESVDSLVARWESQADQLAPLGRDRAALLRQTLITPSCGTGSLSRELAVRVLELTSGVSTVLRNRYGQGKPER